MKEKQWRKEESSSVLSVFRTGYVIELEPKRYLCGFQNGRVCSTVIDRARYFSTFEKAAAYGYRYLGFVGIRLQICLACWTLINPQSLEGEWEFIKGKDGQDLRFLVYQDALRYQKMERQKNSRIEFYVFPEKEIFPAA